MLFAVYRICIPSYTIGQLKPEQATVIASHWGAKNVFHDWPNLTSFFERMIENLVSVGVYPANSDFNNDDDHVTPVAAGIQYACGRLGNLFTVQEYRRRGLGTAVMKMLAQQTRDAGLIPECNIGLDNPNRRLVTKLGFVECENFKPNRMIIA